MPTVIPDDQDLEETTLGALALQILNKAALVVVGMVAIALLVFWAIGPLPPGN